MLFLDKNESLQGTVQKPSKPYYKQSHHNHLGNYMSILHLHFHRLQCPEMQMH